MDGLPVSGPAVTLLTPDRREGDGSEQVTISLEEAEAMMNDTHGDSWEDGTFMIAEVREDADYFGFTYGNREWLLDEDPAFEVTGGWPTFVSKSTGYEETPSGVDSWWAANEHFDQMTLVKDYTQDLGRFVADGSALIRVSPDAPKPGLMPLGRPGGRLDPKAWYDAKEQSEPGL